MKKISPPSRLRALPLAALLVMSALPAWAVEPFNLRDIRVEGLQRVEPGTIFATLPFRVGDNYTDEKGSTAIRVLFGLGLFKDVRLEVSGDVVTVIVEERPTIAGVEFVGTKEFEKDVLEKALREVGLSEGRAFDKALADKAEQELKRQYINRSLYAAQVVTTVTPIDRNRVNLTFAVIEGETAKIKDIQIVGNKVFSQSTLRGLFNLDAGSWLSFYTKSDEYSRTKLNADLETLRTYYLTRGYLEFKIDSTQVAISPDKQSITIAINISEGERFVVSGVKLEGAYLGKEEDFKTLVSIRPGEAYNADDVTQTTKAFTDYFGKFGFAFAQINVRTELDRSNNRVLFILQAEPARRAYVRRIVISGNTRSRDEVVRREFRQLESAWYDGDKIKLSRDRIDRLGYFKEVNVETVELPGSADQVDLAVTIVEKPTGNLQLGAGFSSAEKLALSFSIRQENVFGSGNFLGVEVNTSRFNRTIVLSTTEPYFTQDGVSRTIDVFFRASRPLENQGGTYELQTAGAGVRFGVPFSEIDTVFFGATVEATKIVPGVNIPAVYLAYANRFGFTSSAVPLTIGYSRDDRDSAIVPTRGRLQRITGEIGLVGDANYYRANYQYQQFFPFLSQFTLALNGELGLGGGIGGKPFPVFKNFFSGGLGSVRGFEQGTLGPRDVTGSITGGSNKLTLNAEVLSPFPGSGNDRTLRLFAFVDAGNVFSEDEKFKASELRASAGFGLSWISPVGPLRIAAAKPLKSKPGDRIQKLQFQIGTSF